MWSLVRRSAGSRPAAMAMAMAADAAAARRSLSALPSSANIAPPFPFATARHLPARAPFFPSAGDDARTPLRQRRDLSSRPPGGGGPPGGGMNLGNIFDNARNQRSKKPGETLEEYGVDLTKMAKGGKLDPVIGRHEEIRRTLQILGESLRRVV